MGADGKGGWVGPAVWPPPPTEEEMTVPRLSKSGELVEGWVKRPEDGVWRPADLLWLPPTATKSTDVDGIGQIVDVNDFGGIGDYAWVRAQIAKRQRYVDRIKDMVRAGAVTMTAALAKFLGIDQDGAELLPRTGPPAYGKSSNLAAVKATKEEAMRLINGPSADNRHRYGLCSCHNEYGDPMLPGQA